MIFTIYGLLSLGLLDLFTNHFWMVKKINRNQMGSLQTVDNFFRILRFFLKNNHMDEIDEQWTKFGEIHRKKDSLQRETEREITHTSAYDLLLFFASSTSAISTVVNIEHCEFLCESKSVFSPSRATNVVLSSKSKFSSKKLSPFQIK